MEQTSNITSCESSSATFSAGCHSRGNARGRTGDLRATQSNPEVRVCTSIAHSVFILTRASNREIQIKSRAIWEAAPDYLRYDRQPNEHFHDMWFTTSFIYLDYLYTCFLLYRAVVKHTGTRQADLCDESRRMLAIVVQINSFRTSMVDLGRHFSWIVRLPM